MNAERGSPKHLPDDVLHRLDAALGYPLTLVIAPAGSGKTALLRRWAAARKPAPAWLDLTPEHNDPRRFAAALDAALAIEADAALGLEDAVAGAANAIMARPGDEILVLDHYHLIVAPPVHAAMAWLIEYLPPRMHLILATRGEPPLGVPRLRLRRQLLEIPISALPPSPR